jgi:hypothetical protein
VIGLQSSAITSFDAFRRHSSRQNCLSCHQHYLPMAAVGHAKERAVRLDRAAALRQIELVIEEMDPGTEDVAEAVFSAEPVHGFGYQVLGLTSEYVPAQLGTDAAVHHLAVIQAADGRWQVNIPRPPIQSSDVTATALAILTIKKYGWLGRQAEFERAVDRGRQWLWTAKAETTEEAAYQLLGLHWAGEPPEKLAELAHTLASQQREDGGWAQLATLESDAYATGQALYALARAARRPVSDPKWHQGLRFLLATQHDDGSWHVARRAFPFQPTMTSGYPHHRDAWISAAGTSWAVMAMTQALPTGTTSDKPPAVAKTHRETAAQLRPSVDFQRSIKPLLQRSCLACHGPQQQRSEFRVDSRAALLKGGSSGEAAVVPGSSAESPLIEYVSGRVEGMEMPPVAKRSKFLAMTEDEVDLLRAWIDQGAVWPTPRD